MQPQPAPAAPADLSHLDPLVTTMLAAAAVAAYNDFVGRPIVLPSNYRLVGRFTGWDGWFGSLGSEEKFGLVFKSLEPTLAGKYQFIIAFRGTESLMDIFEDGFWDLTSFQPSIAQGLHPRQPLPAPVRVSAGFYDIYTTKGGSMNLTMQEQLFSLLAGLDSSAEIFITGHSLGGALSQLFTLDVAASLPNVPLRTLNFASPRVGDASWQAACDQVGATGKITRVINYHDIVPDYPLEIMDYVSIGQQFETAFKSFHWFESNPLSNHSMLNLQTVLTNALPLAPQVWVGNFVGADLGIKMQSTAVPSTDRGQLLAKLKEAHEFAQPTPPLPASPVAEVTA